MTMFNYESEEFYQMARGETSPSTPVYVSDCKKEILTEVTPNYPKLSDYEKEWMYFAKNIYEGGTPVPLEYLEVQTYGQATVENVIPFAYKSAIFKGQTLVNLLNFDHVSNSYLFTQDITIKKNVVYTIKGTLNMNNKYSSSDTPVLKIKVTNNDGNDLVSINGTGGSVTKIINQTFKNTSSNVIHIRIFNQNPEKSDFMIIEGNYTNVDIPYFEGMANCEMPVLKTVGKNLISYTNSNQTANTNQNPTDIRYENGGFNFNASNNNWYSVWYDLNLKPNTKYTISYHSNFMDCSIFKSTVNTYVSSEIVAQVGLRNKNESHVQFATLTFTSPNEGFVRIRLTNTQNNGYIVVTNLQLEENSQATSYEPYQSNILSTPSDLELRGIGTVTDELNLLTGELTQRIGEVVLDGSNDEEWKTSIDNGNFRSFQLKNNGKQNSTKFACDKLPNKSSWNESVDGIWADNSIILTLSKDKVNSLSELKNWLSQNPLTVQYELGTKPVKTVDLNIMIKPYEGTNHYTVSSHALPPLLLLSVPIESTGNQTLNDINTEE